MDEKVLIKSEHYNIKKFVKKVLIILVILALLVSAATFLISVISRANWCNSHWNRENETLWEGFDWFVTIFVTAASVGGVIILSLILWLIYAWLRSYEMTVTNKRVYGRVAFGRRIDLPLDSVSAIATSSFLKGVTVSTASGRIGFLLVKNADEIYNTMNQLLLERQQTKNVVPVIPSTPIPSSNTEELKKYKELLDTGVITQEEFDAKKKQLLGL